MNKLLLVGVLLTAGCANIWRAIDDPGHYGTAFQRAEYRHALPCINWCSAEMGINARDKARLSVVRSGRTCLCVFDAPTMRTLPDRSRGERSMSEGGPWLRAEIPDNIPLADLEKE